MFRFDLPPTDGTDGAVGRLKEEDLRRVGLEFSSLQLPNEYLFSRMGGWNVMLRASVVRITFFKLLGTGIAAMLTALSPHTGRYTAFSCALCAAVNFVACGHYWCALRVKAPQPLLTVHCAPWQVHLAGAAADLPRAQVRQVHVQRGPRGSRGHRARRGGQAGRAPGVLAGGHCGRLAVRCTPYSTCAFLLTCPFSSAATATGSSRSVGAYLNS